ncbi:response regulator [Benzoatithermus flavus]|uniref:Response regulator n=1 Tax=Benzoatithermus flavus TaxID=3108223 RepID=A0ABU8XM72_9PROT
MRVLLVEDNFIIALDLAGLVREAGAEPVGPVASVRDAIAALGDASIEAVILDINLGEENALALVDDLRQRSIPFAFATGYSPDDVLPPECADVPVLAKPYSAVEVRALLDVLRRHREAGGDRTAP